MKAFVLHDDPMLATRVKAALRRAIQRAEATTLWPITLRQLISGEVEVNGVKMRPGDGTSLDREREATLKSTIGAHFILFNLN